MTAAAPDASPLLDRCPASLPAAAYHDPLWFAQEERAIWRRNWICAGRLNDLPPGTLRRLAIGGQNLILCRAADGGVTAFHNTCRHRGSELCPTAEKPLGRLITCPYHNWAYDLAGRLVSTAFATPTPEFDRAEHGLFPVAVRNWNGFLFLNLAREPGPLAPDLGLAALDNWPMQSLVTGHRLTSDLACNWKIFWENYNECLHCPGIHPELCDMVPIYRQGVMAANELAVAPPPAPVLKEGARSWTMTGAPCGPEFPGLTAAERDRGFTFVTLYPTMFIVAHVDYVRAVTVTPLGPEQTRLTAEWLFPAETLAQPGFDAAEVARFATLVLQQDGAACEMNQRGLRSAHFLAGRLMPQEFDILKFHDWVRAEMAADQGE